MQYDILTSYGTLYFLCCTTERHGNILRQLLSHLNKVQQLLSHLMSGPLCNCRRRCRGVEVTSRKGRCQSSIGRAMFSNRLYSLELQSDKTSHGMKSHDMNNQIVTV